MEHALVLGTETPLGLAVAEALVATAAAKVFVAASGAQTSGAEVSGAQAIELSLDHRGVAEKLLAHQIDTVFHCGLAASHSDAGTRTHADVIGMMKLCTAIGRRDGPVRSLVVASSGDAYRPRSYAPLLFKEVDVCGSRDEDPGASILEAEDYARDMARHAAHLDIAILRLAELAGPRCHSRVAELLSAPAPAVLAGFDPLVQLLHERDAVDAVIFAGQRELAGIYNVASRDTLRLSEMLQHLGRRAVRVPDLAVAPVAWLLSRLGLPHVPAQAADLLRFGRALDCDKLAAAGFHPKFDQRDCLDELGARTRRRGS